MSKKQISFWPLLIEFLSVVFAVLLALGLNSYKQTQDLKKESETLTSKILAECSRNMSALDSVNVQNREYLQYLDSLLASEHEIKGFRIDISGELLHSSTWKYTQNSPAFNYIDGELLNDATEVYELQDYYMNISSQMIQNIGEFQLRSNVVETETLLKTCRYYIRNIVSAGDQLEETYEKILTDYQYDDLSIPEAFN